jgi:hypothetical protein
MKRLSYLSFLCVVLLMLLPARTLAQCGVERWSVKTGTDPDAGLVSLSSVNPATIASLTTITTPASLPDNNRVQPTETTVWVISATLVKYVRAYDSDYHMVLSDSAGRTMIAEIPAPGCVGPGSPFAASIAHARAQFDAMFTATTTFQNANVPVQITGVGFFDHLEGQEGLAPNGIELHPIVDILFNPNFSISASPTALTIAQGGSGTSTITTTLSGNFNSSIALSASGLPAGVTASFTPSSIGAPGAGSSILTISAGAAAPVGTYNVVVNGTGGGQTHSTTINLTVTSGGGTTQQLLGNPGFENGSANPAPWTVTAGVIDNSTFEAPHTGSWKAWLNGYGSVHTDSILQQVSIPSTASQTALSFWLHIDTAETTTTTAYDTLKVQLRNSSGAVLTTLATYSNLNAGAGYTQVSFDVSSYKGQTIQIFLVGTEDASLKTSFVVDDFALNATTTGDAAADFAISSSPSALAIAQGSSGTSTITTTLSGSFNSAVALTAAGLPAGATASFSPTPIAAPGAGSSTLTISAGSTTAVGTYSVTVNGSGGSLARAATINLTVTAVSGGTTQQLLGNPGFENGLTNPAPWTVTAGVIDTSTFEAPHTGSWKAWLDGYGSAHTDTILQQVIIPSTATQATLSFWLHIDTLETSTTKANDTLKLQVRNSSGTVLATLATYSNLNAAPGYAQVSFDLSAYKGQTIQIYLIGVENSTLKTSFVVDDFLLNVVTP